MRDRLLILTLMTEIWALEEGYFDKLSLIIMSHAAGEEVSAADVERLVAAREAKPTDNVKRPYELRGAVAVLPIGGVLAQYASQVNGASQPRGTSYESIREAVRAAQADPQVGSIALLIDSPGGAISGLSAAADTLYAHRTRPGAKPIVAHVAGMMASAAVWLGSQASRITAESTGDDIGSIGVRTQRVDLSQLYERAGIKVHSLKTAAAKDDGFPYKPMSEEEKGRIEASLHEGLRLFKSAITRGRGVDAAVVDGWADARIHHADRALAMGMIDGIKPFEQVVAELNTQYPAPSARTGASGVTHHAGPVGAATSMQGSTDMNGRRLISATGALLSIDALGGNGSGGGGAPTPTAPAPDADAITADALKQERARVAAINTRAAAYLNKPGVSALVNEAIEKGYSPEKFSDALLTSIAVTQAPIGGTQTPVTVGTEDRTKKRNAHTLAMLDRLNPSLDAELSGPNAARVARAAGFSDTASAQRAFADVRASGFRRHRLLDMYRLSALVAGASIPDDASPDEIMAAAAHSRSDLPHVFADTMNRTLAVRGAIVPSIWREVARKATANDFRDRRIISLGGVGDLEELPEGKQPKETSVTDREEVGSIKTYARSFSITRQMVIDDDLNAIAEILRMVDDRTTAKPDRLLAAALALNSGAGPIMSDGKAMFHTDHRNLAGSGGAIATTTLHAAAIAMMNQRGFGEGADEVVPRYPAKILVPTALGPVAELYYANDKNPDGSASTAHQANAHRNKYKPVVNPYLSSSTRWYLFADPNRSAAFEMIFLDGRESAIFNPVGNGSILKQRYEWVFDCGIAAVEYEAAYANPG